jgi:hypothetical protein
MNDVAYHEVAKTGLRALQHGQVIPIPEVGAHAVHSTPGQQS